MLAPVVALMRLPLIAAEARNSGKWAAESALAVNEKMAAMAEGAFAAHMSLLGSASQLARGACRQDAGRPQRRCRRAFARCGHGAGQPARRR
jgi:hypothetical protein